MSVAVGCTTPPAVEVTTRVGQAKSLHTGPGSVETPEYPASLVRSKPAPPADAGFKPRPPTSSADFSQLNKALARVPNDQMVVVARNMAQAGTNLWPEVRTELLLPRKRSKSEYKTVLATIGGDVPNRYGHFALRWKRDHGHRVKLSDDWFEDLLAVPTDKISRVMRPVFRDAIRQSALLRAASNIGQTKPELAGEVIETLLDVAYLHKGTFRDEVGRAIQSIGSNAIPALLRETRYLEDDRADESLAKRGKYAQFNLDRMNRLDPRLALDATRHRLSLFLETVEAYETSRSGPAARHLLSLCDNAVPRVQAAARQAFLGYVSGPPPKRTRKTVRLMGGGTATRTLQASYREMAGKAVRSRLQNSFPELLEEPCKQWLESGTLDQECLQQPFRHTNLYFEKLDGIKRDTRRQSVTTALSSSDMAEAKRILDEQIALGAPIPMAESVAEFYLTQARLSAKFPEEAIRTSRLYRQASSAIDQLDPNEAARTRNVALLFEATAPGVSEAGRKMILSAVDQSLLSVSELHRIEQSQDGQAPSAGTGKSTLSRIETVAGLAALWAAFTCMMLLAWPRRRYSDKYRPR